MLQSLRPVDVVITDNFLGGPAGICAIRGVPYYSFCTANATMLQVILSLHEDSLTVSDEKAEPFLRVPEKGAPPIPVPEKMKQLMMPMRSSLNKARGVIVNSLRDLELDALNDVAEHPDMEKLTVHCVGPLLPEETSTEGNPKTSENVTETAVGNWLDRQAEDSVVYVSFGSVAMPPPEQVAIIGRALLELGKPFIWAIREKYHGGLPEEISTAIGKQFEEESGGKCLILNWAPQKLILRHDAVAVFVSHW